MAKERWRVGLTRPNKDDGTEHARVRPILQAEVPCGSEVQYVWIWHSGKGPLDARLTLIAGATSADTPHRAGSPSSPIQIADARQQTADAHAVWSTVEGAGSAGDSVTLY